jgi:hypothetical protein
MPGYKAMVNDLPIRVHSLRSERELPAWSRFCALRGFAHRGPGDPQRFAARVSHDPYSRLGGVVVATLAADAPEAAEGARRSDVRARGARTRHVLYDLRRHRNLPGRAGHDLLLDHDGARAAAEHERLGGRDLLHLLRVDGGNVGRQD